MSARFEPITGRYMHLDLFGRPHRIYVEEAGEGSPLLCLHTAGSDGRQYRGLMNDARVTEKHRVIAFDMPWHGKSSPPFGWHDGCALDAASLQTIARRKGFAAQALPFSSTLPMG